MKLFRIIFSTRVGLMERNWTRLNTYCVWRRFFWTHWKQNLRLWSVSSNWRKLSRQ